MEKGTGEVLEEDNRWCGKEVLGLIGIKTHRTTYKKISILLFNFVVIFSKNQMRRRKKKRKKKKKSRKLGQLYLAEKTVSILHIPRLHHSNSSFGRRSALPCDPKRRGRISR